MLTFCKAFGGMFFPSSSGFSWLLSVLVMGLSVSGYVFACVKYGGVSFIDVV